MSESTLDGKLRCLRTLLHQIGAQVGAEAVGDAIGMLNAYADLREQIERAREGVTGEVLDQACFAAINRTPGSMERHVRQGHQEQLAFRNDVQAALLAVAHLLPSGERGGVEKPAGFGIACTVTWTELYDAMAADGMSPPNKCGQATRKWIEQVVRDYLNHPPAQAAQVDALPDPLGCNECTHPDCGRYNGPRSVECRAMLNNACARPNGNQPYNAPTAEPVAQGEVSPAGYHYVYRDTDGGEVIRKNGGQEVNGSKPLRAIPYWYAQPASPEQPAGRQGEAPTLRQWRPKGRDNWKWNDFDPQTTDDEIERYREKYDYRELFAHPAEPVGVPDGLPRGWRAALAYAIDTLDCEIDIRENDSDPGNRNMKRNQTVLRQLLEALAAAPSAPQGVE